MFHSAAIQKAMYEALTADEALMLLVGGRVQDCVDHNALFPYVSLGEATETPQDALDKYGAMASVTVHIWSRERGMLESQMIGKRIFAALDDKRLVIDGTQCVECRCDLSQTLRELDGVTRHGILRFRVTTFDV